MSLIAAALLLGAGPLAGEAQQGRTLARIGAFHVGDHLPPGLAALRDGLTAIGYEEGKSLHLDFRNLATEAEADRTAHEFVAARRDVIVAFGNPTVRAAQAATGEIPIVMLHVTDPVAQGFVRTLARPGGNLTGFVFFAVSPAKHVELFKEMMPRLRRVLVVVDPHDPTARSHLAAMRQAAATLQLTLIERDAANQADLDRVFAALKPSDVDGVMAASISLHIKFTTLLLRLAAAKRLPVAGYRHEAVQHGALFAYAPDDAAVGRRAATYVDKILKGAKPADLPVEQPTKFELVINVRTARTLGITIPHALALRADRVIE